VSQQKKNGPVLIIDEFNQLEIEVNSVVVSSSGEAIPGLYAAGEEYLGMKSVPFCVQSTHQRSTIAQVA